MLKISVLHCKYHKKLLNDELKMIAQKLTMQPIKLKEYFSYLITILFNFFNYTRTVV